MNMDYIKARKKPTVDITFIDSVIKKHFSGLDKLLSVNSNKKSAIAQREAIMSEALDVLQKQLMPNKQEQLTSMIKQNGTKTDSNQLLSNIISNIQMCFGGYSINDITNMFNKVYSIDGNKKKSEQELTQLIVRKLQAIQKTKTVKGIKPSAAEIRMNLSSAYAPNSST